MCLVVIVGVAAVEGMSLVGALVRVMDCCGEERSCTRGSGLIVAVGYDSALLLDLCENKQEFQRYEQLMLDTIYTVESTHLYMQYYYTHSVVLPLVAVSESSSQLDYLSESTTISLSTSCSG